MVAGAANRLRFINIMANGGVVMRLTRDGVPVTWTLVAKDGADLPAHQRIPTAATGFRIVAGETYDFEITPAPGEMVLRYLPPERPPTEVRVIAAAGAARP